MTELISKDVEGLRIAAYAGANSVLIAMSVPDAATANLAGFAIWRQRDGEPEQALPNRLNFDDPVTSATTPQQREWTDSDEAPFQKFRWVDIPADGTDKSATYRVCAMYFTGEGKAIKKGPEASVVVPPVGHRYTKFRAAFTRGYISSQAYADKFHNADIRPKPPKTPDFDTKPYQAQYAWLGAGAREQLFAFLDDCKSDASCKVDVYAYDLDEPDVVAAICQFGREKRLRAVLDNAKLHTGNAPEVRAAALIKAAAGDDNVVQGHFSRFQHSKVFIKRDSAGTAQRVLFGSMNFSVRGIYVQSNNIIVADDPTAAGYFEAAFENAFTNKTSTAKFAQAGVAKDYNVISAGATADLPECKIALSPHTDASISLGPASARVRAATSSVLYGVMQPKGTGDLLSSLQTIAAKPTVFSYGTVETSKGLAVQRGDGAMGDVADFAYLKSKVPYPFATEFDPGPGMHIHDKFIVVDFNGDNPTVFTGSSNLAEGGEKANGDSLIMIADEVLATVYAIEALKIFDHYSFRDKMKAATAADPLTLWYPGKPGAPQPWWTPAYDQTNIKFRDRCLFAAIPLPATLDSHKAVDWSSIGMPPKGGGSGSGGGKKKSPATGGGATKKGRGKAGQAAKPAAKPKKPAKTKPPQKGAAKKKAAAKKAPVKKMPAKKTTAKKTAAKKTPAKKAPAKRTAKKAAAKRPAAKKPPTKRTSRKAPAKPAKRTPAKRTPAKRGRGR
jgi:phosphatidylserine/phosphatidylglycerophosphate/cardiolipin synthase-like enzyme